MMFRLMVVKSDEDVDGYGDGDRRDPARRAVLHPSPFPPNLLLVLRLTAPYLIPYLIPSIITLFTIIVLDKAFHYSIKSNPALVLIIVLIIVLDKAFALAPNARYRYRTCSIFALSPL